MPKRNANGNIIYRDDFGDLIVKIAEKKANQSGKDSKVFDKTLYELFYENTEYKITDKTFGSWRRKFPEFDEACKKAKNILCDAKYIKYNDTLPSKLINYFSSPKFDDFGRFVPPRVYQFCMAENISYQMFKRWTSEKSDIYKPELREALLTCREIMAEELNANGITGTANSNFTRFYLESICGQKSVSEQIVKADINANVEISDEDRKLLESLRGRTDAEAEE